jgi:riboflavin synthase
MFSGLIQTIGKIIKNQGTELVVETNSLSPQCGDSIAVHGICLTVKRIEPQGTKNRLWFDLSQETRHRTTIRKCKKGKPVNLEAALKATDVLGGHIVQGHVDGVGQVQQIAVHKKDKTMWFKIPASLNVFIVEKGSITVDGVSLTVAQRTDDLFSVSLVPYTRQHTTLDTLKKNDQVNLEVDIIGKYVWQYVRPYLGSHEK